MFSRCYANVFYAPTLTNVLLIRTWKAGLKCEFLDSLGTELLFEVWRACHRPPAHLPCLPCTHKGAPTHTAKLIPAPTESHLLAILRAQGLHASGVSPLRRKGSKKRCAQSGHRLGHFYR